MVLRNNNFERPKEEIVVNSETRSLSLKNSKQFVGISYLGNPNSNANQNSNRDVKKLISNKITKLNVAKINLKEN